MLKYSLLFLPAFALCYGLLFRLGRLPIWNVDGAMQHFPFAAYLGQWIRESICGVFRGEGIRLFDFSLGFGEDLIVSLNYYGLGDPVSLVMALFPISNAEFAFTLAMVIRIWLAGAATLLLTGCYDMNDRQRIGAALIYAFSFEMLTLAVLEQSIFAPPFMHLPLILYGFEKLRTDKSSFALSVAVMLSAINGFYFAFYNSVLLLIYALIRTCTADGFKALGQTACRALARYALGLGLAAVIFLPATYGFLASTRAAGSVNLSAFRLTYPLHNYLRLPLAMTTTFRMGAVPFVTVVGLLSMAALWMKKRDRVFMIVGLMMIVIPGVSWFFNFFSYEVYRWVYAASLLVAVLTVKGLPLLKEVPKKGYVLQLVLSVLFIVYLLYVTLHTTAAVRRSAYVAVGAVVIAAVAVGLMRKNRRVGTILLVAVIALQVVCCNANFISTRYPVMTEIGESAHRFEENPYAGLEPTEGFARTDTNLHTTSITLNGSALTDIPATTIYDSIFSGSVYQLLRRVESPSALHANAIAGLDGRAALEAVFSVDRYAVTEGTVPYGFTENGDGVYVNENTVPMGYLMTHRLSVSDFDALSPLERQWALLQCIVSDDVDLPEVDLERNLSEVPIVSTERDGLSGDGSVICAEAGAAVRIHADIPADSEIYIAIADFACHDGSITVDQITEITCGEDVNYPLMVPPSLPSYLKDREVCYYCLGTCEEARDEIVIRFPLPGTYTIGDIRIYAQPMATFTDHTDRLRENGMTDVKVGVNRVSGTIDAATDGALVLSVPVSKGWTVKVDGKKTETVAQADALIAVPVEKGVHTVELTYRTPMLAAGELISLLSLALLITLKFRNRRKVTCNGK
ncbi:MAG: YfhO family protein [Clostridia bacterium]|nr:YfhO family protein [Clostridia bacterium]